MMNETQPMTTRKNPEPPNNSRRAQHSWAPAVVTSLAGGIQPKEEQEARKGRCWTHLSSLGFVLSDPKRPSPPSEAGPLANPWSLKSSPPVEIGISNPIDWWTDSSFGLWRAWGSAIELTQFCVHQNVIFTPMIISISNICPLKY